MEPHASHPCNPSQYTLTVTSASGDSVTFQIMASTAEKKLNSHSHKKASQSQ